MCLLLSPRGVGTPYRLEHIRADWGLLRFLITLSLMTVARLFPWRPPFHWLHLSRAPAVPRKPAHRNLSAPLCRSTYVRVFVLGPGPRAAGGDTSMELLLSQAFGPGSPKGLEMGCSLSTHASQRPAVGAEDCWGPNDAMAMKRKQWPWIDIANLCTTIVWSTVLLDEMTTVVFNSVLESDAYFSSNGVFSYVKIIAGLLLIVTTFLPGTAFSVNSVLLW